MKKSFLRLLCACLVFCMCLPFIPAFSVGATTAITADRDTVQSGASFIYFDNYNATANTITSAGRTISITGTHNDGRNFCNVTSASDEGYGIKLTQGSTDINQWIVYINLPSGSYPNFLSAVGRYFTMRVKIVNSGLESFGFGYRCSHATEYDKTIYPTGEWQVITVPCTQNGAIDGTGWNSYNDDCINFIGDFAAGTYILVDYIGIVWGDDYQAKADAEAATQSILWQKLDGTYVEPEVEFEPIAGRDMLTSGSCFLYFDDIKTNGETGSINSAGNTVTIKQNGVYTYAEKATSSGLGLKLTKGEQATDQLLFYFSTNNYGNSFLTDHSGRYVTLRFKILNAGIARGNVRIGNSNQNSYYSTSYDITGDWQTVTVDWKAWGAIHPTGNLSLNFSSAVSGKTFSDDVEIYVDYIGVLYGTSWEQKEATHRATQESIWAQIGPDDVVTNLRATDQSIYFDSVSGSTFTNSYNGSTITLNTPTTGRPTYSPATVEGFGLKITNGTSIKISAGRNIGRTWTFGIRYKIVNADVDASKTYKLNVWSSNYQSSTYGISNSEGNNAPTMPTPNGQWQTLTTTITTSTMSGNFANIGADNANIQVDFPSDLGANAVIYVDFLGFYKPSDTQTGLQIFTEDAAAQQALYEKIELFGFEGVQVKKNGKDVVADTRRLTYFDGLNGTSFAGGTLEGANYSGNVYGTYGIALNPGETTLTWTSTKYWIFGTSLFVRYRVLNYDANATGGTAYVKNLNASNSNTIGINLPAPNGEWQVASVDCTLEAVGATGGNYLNGTQRGRIIFPSFGSNAVIQIDCAGTIAPDALDAFLDIQDSNWEKAEAQSGVTFVRPAAQDSVLSAASSTNIRLIGMLKDHEEADSVGFKITLKTANGQTSYNKKSVNVVYDSVISNGNPMTSGDIDPLRNGQSIFTYAIKSIPLNIGTVNVTVQPFVTKNSVDVSTLSYSFDYNTAWTNEAEAISNFKISTAYVTTSAAFDKYNDLYDQRREEIANAQSQWTLGTGGTVYYVSPTGNDSAAGTSAATAWKTVERVNDQALNAGDVVLFERGGIWNRQESLQMSDGVTYSAYGTGAKPMFSYYIQATSTSDWLEVEPNIWVYNGEYSSNPANIDGKLSDHPNDASIPGSYITSTNYDHITNDDIGHITFVKGSVTGFGVKVTKMHDPSNYLNSGTSYDYSENTGMYDTGMGFDLVNRVHYWSNNVVIKQVFADESDLVTNLEFYHNPKTSRVYLYFDQGNPANYFDDIKMTVRNYGICGSANNTTLDNIAVSYYGAHGINLGYAQNFTMRNCELTYIGGSIQTYTFGNREYPTRFGEGIQCWGYCDGFYLINNIFESVYDGATSVQGNDYRESAEIKNVKVEGNVFDKNTASIEFWFSPNAAFDRNNFWFRNCSFSDNIIRGGGTGFGQVRHVGGGATDITLKIPMQENVRICDNIIIAPVSSIPLQFNHFDTTTGAYAYGNTFVCVYGNPLANAHVTGTMPNDPNYLYYHTSRATVQNAILLDWANKFGDNQYIFIK